MLHRSPRRTASATWAQPRECGLNEQQIVWRYLNRQGGDRAEATPALLELAWSSPAALALAPLQDLLNLGSEARMNVPGTAEGNWRWRCTPDMLEAPAFQRLRDLTETSNRLSRGRLPGVVTIRSPENDVDFTTEALSRPAW